MGFMDHALEQDQQLGCVADTVFVAENCSLGITRGFRNGILVAHLALNETSEITSAHFSWGQAED